jgi:hypothetical protein
MAYSDVQWKSQPFNHASRIARKRRQVRHQSPDRCLTRQADQHVASLTRQNLVSGIVSFTPRSRQFAEMRTDGPPLRHPRRLARLGGRLALANHHPGWPVEPSAVIVVRGASREISIQRNSGGNNRPGAIPADSRSPTAATTYD